MMMLVIMVMQVMMAIMMMKREKKKGEGEKEMTYTEMQRDTETDSRTERWDNKEKQTNGLTGRRADRQAGRQRRKPSETKRTLSPLCS